jgi:UDPglucose--hexose-1-phosphate uridylyltransferase
MTTESAPPAALPADPHRRFNQLTGQWVLVSAGRTNRPWQGQEESPPAEERPAYDPTCYLCPGNTRAGGHTNPTYESTFVFTNDFAALRPDTDPGGLVDGLLVAEGEQGTCRVICFSPRHDVTLAQMAEADVLRVVELWASQTEELGAQFPWVQVFENRGPEMGASNPHPHGQIWAGSAIPNEALAEMTTQRAYAEQTERRLLLDYAAQESGGPRVVVENDDWLVVVPFWAIWPFETIMVPRAPAARLGELDEAARVSLVRALHELQARYDNLFRRSFPFSMGWHQAPFVPGAVDSWQLHAHFYPPLLRSATVRKFMVGYELLSEAQRDITPEEAAERLRQLPAERYDTR